MHWEVGWEAWLLDCSILCGAVPSKGLLMSYKLFPNMHVYSIYDYSSHQFLSIILFYFSSQIQLWRQAKYFQKTNSSFSDFTTRQQPNKKTEGNTNTAVTAKSLKTVHYFCDKIKLQTETTLMVWCTRWKEKTVLSHCGCKV